MRASAGGVTPCGEAPLLYEFIAANREALIDRARAKVALRSAPTPTEQELTNGVPLFLDQLAETLQFPLSSTSDTMERSASLHGAALLAAGYTVAQVVHDYGDICQSITELADETDAPITTHEFRTLNGCLDNAIADAVTEFTRLRGRSAVDGEAERAGVLAHELRNRVSAAQLAFLAIKSGRAPVNGSVAAVVTRSLVGMTTLIDRALVEVRLDSGHTRPQRVRLRQMIEEAEVDGAMEAGVHGVSLRVTPTDQTIAVHADPQILAGAIANLLQNAFKFTPAGGQVSLEASVVDGHVEIAIADACGGLPPGKAEQLFGAFQQGSADRRGLGLGLYISRKGIEASGGVIRVRDVPGHGCVFTIELPMVPPDA